MEEFFASVMEFLKSVEGASITVAIVLDFAFRMIPSKKPLSVLHVVAEVCKKSGEALTKFAQILDKVLPQKVKEE